jgi:hypothetical protein
MLRVDGCNIHNMGIHSHCWKDEARNDVQNKNLVDINGCSKIQSFKLEKYVIFLEHTKIFQKNSHYKYFHITTIRKMMNKRKRELTIIKLDEKFLKQQNSFPCECAICENYLNIFIKNYRFVVPSPSSSYHVLKYLQYHSEFISSSSSARKKSGRNVVTIKFYAVARES